MVDEKSFEKLIEEIKETVKKIENENIDLNDALKLFEEGITLISNADKQLKNIKSRVLKIIQDNKMTDLKIQDEN